MERFDKGVTCAPQTDFPSITLRSSGNYYSYRNGRILLDLDTSTGLARRIIIGETEDGEVVFLRQEFCFYSRTDDVTEPVNPVDYKNQILFDLEQSASSRLFTPMEIFTYEIHGDGTVTTLRFDQNEDVSWHFCNPESLLRPFCLGAYGGNDFYYPDPPDQVIQDQLVAATILIRSEYHYLKINKSEFEDLWTSLPGSAYEVGTEKFLSSNSNWLYPVIPIPDEPLFVGRMWRSWLRRERDFMPQVDSIKIPLICYSATREVLLEDGSTAFIDGEVCQNNGFQWTPY